MDAIGLLAAMYLGYEVIGFAWKRVHYRKV
jgi:hypothetical protein